MRVRGKGLPAPNRETPTAGGWRPRLCGRVESVMAQLCGLRRCWALLALLASLLLFRAEAADGERDVHGEGPDESPGKGGWPRSKSWALGAGCGGVSWRPRGPGQGLSGENWRGRKLGATY